MPTNSEYSIVRCDGDMSRERGEGRQGPSGEPHGMASPYAPETPGDPSQTYPDVWRYGYDSENPQFSSKMSGDPVELLESTRPGIDAHAALNESYGLCQPVATLGSHPFLRDELSSPTELEPGNAEPKSGLQIPKRSF
jgi:hypothetical protein